MAKAKIGKIDESKQQRQREDERFTYRILITFGIIAVILIALMRIDAAVLKGQGIGAITKAAGVVALVGGIGAVLLLAAACVLHGRHSKPGATLCGYGAALCAMLAVSGLYMTLYLKTTFFDSMLPLYIILPSAALLYLLMFIYSREFILQAVMAGGSAVGFWLLKRVLQSREGSVREIIAMGLFALMVLLALGLAALLKKNHGVFKLGTRSRRLLPADCRYRLVFLTCLLPALGLVLTLPLGWMAAWISMIVCLVYIFLLAIYYTTRLI